MPRVEIVLARSFQSKDNLSRVLYMGQVKTIIQLADTKFSIFILIWSLFLLNTVLDLVGIALVGPFIAMVIDPSVLKQTWVGSLIINVLKIESDSDLIQSIGVLICLVAAARAIFGLLSTKVILMFCHAAQAQMKLKLLRSYLAYDYATFIEKKPSEYLHMINAVTSDFMKLLSALLKTGSDLIIGISIFIFLGFVNIEFLLIIVVGSAIIVILLTVFVRRKLQQYGKLGNEISSSIIQIINDALRGFRELSVFGVSSVFLKKMSAKTQELASINATADLINELPRYFFEGIITLFIVVLVIYTTLIQIPATETLALIGFYGFAGVRVLPLMRSLSFFFNQLHFRSDSLLRLQQDLSDVDFSQKIPEVHMSKPKETRFKSLCFDEVCFSYGKSDALLLEKVSFEISAGEVVGICGRSGEGKSTVLDLLLGLLKPVSGRITINQRDRDWEERTIFHGIGLVSQDVLIMNATVAENIVLTDNKQNIDNKKLEFAMQVSASSAFIRNLPKGADTMLSDRGVGLSGGQRQRIGIARAIYHGSHFIVLDECTSALDRITENQIIKMIKNLRGVVTVVLVTHNSEMLDVCDTVYQINKGKFVKVNHH